MANVLNRATLEYRRSVSEPHYPQPDWIHNPDMSAVIGVDRRYWKLSGDAPVPMTQGEQDAVDAAETDARREATADEVEADQTVLRAFAELMIDEINILRQQFNDTTGATPAVPNTNYQPRTLRQFRNAMRGKLNGNG